MPFLFAMIPYPNINPDLLVLGPVRVRWYGIMYLLGFLIGRQIARRLSKSGFLRLSIDAVDDMIVALFIGMLIGARILYMVVYHRPPEGEQWQWYEFLEVWKGGLSIHGALIGMVAALVWFARRHKADFWNLADVLALCGSAGIILGRIGNFINAELPGRVTDVAWAMSFPVRYPNEQGDMVTVGWTEPRHPSQLYEALGEGLLPLIVVWIYKRYARREGSIGAIWVCTYAIARFCIEFFRDKDEQLSYYFGWMTMGQILCAIMFAIGIGLFVYSSRRGTPITSKPSTV